MKYRALDYLRAFDVRGSREKFSKEEHMRSGFWVIGESRDEEDDIYVFWGINLTVAHSFKFYA